MYQNITNMKIYKSEGVEIPLAIGYNVIESPYVGIVFPQTEVAHLI